jgi:hypothetical protein
MYMEYHRPMTLDLNKLAFVQTEAYRQEKEIYIKLRQQCVMLIHMASGVRRTDIYFQLPKFIPGFFPYNIEKIKKQLVASFESEGFAIIQEERAIYISWKKMIEKNLKTIEENALKY